MNTQLVFQKIAKGRNAGVLLLHFYNCGIDEWFEYDIYNVGKKTGLDRYQQKTAMTALRRNGFIEKYNGRYKLNSRFLLNKISEVYGGVR